MCFRTRIHPILQGQYYSPHMTNICGTGLEFHIICFFYSPELPFVCVKSIIRKRKKSDSMQKTISIHKRNRIDDSVIYSLIPLSAKFEAILFTWTNNAASPMQINMQNSLSYCYTFIKVNCWHVDPFLINNIISSVI